MSGPYDFYFKVMKSYPNGSRDCVHTEYNGGTLSDARKYAMKLFKRFDLNANGYVSISKNGKKMDYYDCVVSRFGFRMYTRKWIYQ